MFMAPIAGHCTNNNWHGTDRVRLLQRELPVDLVYKGAKRGGVSTIVSTVTPLTASHLAFAMIFIANGSPGVHPLPDGEIGQEITLLLLADPNYIIEDDTAGDMTKTGWVSINFTSVNGWVKVAWVSDIFGWVITGHNDVTITY